MTWFDIVKRGAKINREDFKEFLQKKINKDGYVILGVKTVVDVFDDYKDFLQEKHKQAITSDEQKNLTKRIAAISRSLRYSSARFNTLANGMASNMFRIKINKDTPAEGDLVGVKKEITRGGSVYFKNMDARNKYVEQARKIVNKKRYTQRRREEFR